VSVLVYHDLLASRCRQMYLIIQTSQEFYATHVTCGCFIDTLKVC